MAAERDAPVAARRVVHRVVEARRRHLRRRAGQRFADLVRDLAVGSARREDGRDVASIVDARIGERLGPDAERLARRRRKPALLVRRQRDRRRRLADRIAIVSRAAVHHAPRRRPVGKPGRPHCAAEDGDLHDAAAKTSEQLLPPKPNEFDSAARTGASRPASSTLPRMAGSTVLQLSVPGMNPSRIAQCGDHRLDEARCPQRVPGPALRGAAGNVVAEHVANRGILGNVVGRAWRSRAGSRNRSRRRRSPALCKRFAHGDRRADALGMRRRQVMRVRALAVAGQHHVGVTALAREQRRSLRLRPARFRRARHRRDGRARGKAVPATRSREAS